jgi:DNA mismatch repair protein MutL
MPLTAAIGRFQEHRVGRIRLLSDGLINRIAAGEVVERPASVVKELVENALDAGARSVDVRLERGGKALIEVRDDGSGMERDDALLAVERHATSKLRVTEDLESIATLGFRGEALSSIAAVSRFTLTTAVREGEGVELSIEAGEVRDVREVAHPRGTTIRVERLFLNVPARRKFLRTDATELTHATRWLTRYALSYFDRRFLLRHGERRILDTDPAGDLRGRIVQIHGRELADKLLPFELVADGLEVRGFAGRPVDALPRREAQHVFVNGRVVQDRVLSHAISQAYGNTMPPGRHPALFLFIRMDPATVDVNVHPQKTEVRFRDSSRVHQTVRATIADALSQGGAVPSLEDLRPGSAQAAAVREATLNYLSRRDAAMPAGERPRTGASMPGGATRRPAQVAATATLDEQAGDPIGAVSLAQYRDSYIVAQDEAGLVLVDQHAAHERVLFERYLADAEANRVEVQQLMFPITIELSPAEALAAEEEREEFARLGFRVEAFGGNTVRLEGVPAVGAKVDPEAFFRELLGEAAEAKSAATDVEALRRRLVTTAACHAAIKINHPLTQPAMQALLDDLYRVRNPTTCPHGRPAIFRLGIDEIERAFRRR